MTIYSWFLKNKTKENSVEGTIENELEAITKTSNYLDNFTMWPTAKIKPDADIIPQRYRNNDAKKSNNERDDLSTETIFTTIE